MKAIKKATIKQIELAQKQTEGATFADLMCDVVLDGDWRWNGCWLIGAKARRDGAAEPQIRCLEECAVASLVEGIGLIPSTSW